MPSGGIAKNHLGYGQRELRRDTAAAKFVKNKKPLTLYLIGHFLEPVVRHLKNRKRGANHEVLLDFTNYRPEWNKAVAAAGLGTWDPKKRLRTGVRIHDCRCSGAINAVDAGIEWDIVKKIGGWKTDEMLSRYNVLTDKRVKAAMEKLSEHTRDKLKKAQEKQQQEQKVNVLVPSQSTATSAYQN